MSDESQNNAGGNEGGAGGAVEFPKWMSSLPDDYKSNETLAQFKEGLPYDKIVSLLGSEKSMITIPGKDAKPEEVAAFYQKLGRPDTVDGYEITKPADLPEGVPFDPEMVKAFKEFAHTEGLSKSQAEELFGWYYNLVKNGHAVESKQKADAEAQADQERIRVQKSAVDALKTEWKDKFDGNIAKSIIGFKSFSKDMPEAEKLLDVTVTDEKLGTIRLGDHPIFNRLFFNIATAILGDSALSGKDGGVGEKGDKDASVAKSMFPSMNK